ncbi:MAG: fibronectin type III domain-containing protein, partial [Eubacteriales bacterium]|nr:fibronectin type III domain-containing protein [Eubacteriales bacterium]
TPGKTDPGTTDPGKSGTDTPTVPAVLTGAQIEAEILAMKGEADPKLGRFSALCVTAMPKSKTSVRLKWNAVQGATTYVIYGSKCGKTDAYQRIAATSKTSFIQKKLKKGTYYKYIVVALSKDYVSSVSTTVHVATKGGSVGNVKTVKPRKSKVKIKVGKTSKIKTTVTPQSKKLKVKNHKKLAYESSDPMIATVTGKGVIQGVSAGTCTIYVYAQNGVYKKIQVTVK